jgi:RNA polymerase sigma-70 factor (ECF subfamily)
MTTLRFQSIGGASVDGDGLGPFPSSRATEREAGLVQRARRGDRDAFAQLYRAHGAMVHAILLARVARADADDLTQEVFLAAWRDLGHLRDVDALAGWLASIARMKAADWLRAAARRARREARVARTETDRAIQRADAMLAVIRSLPPAYAETLTLRLIAELSGPQIAHRLGMTPGSVRVNLHRGMAMLRRRLSEDQR